MTGNQKIKHHAELCETTRQIIGRTTVPAARLKKINSRTGFAEVVIDNRVYEAELFGKSFYLTGNYLTLA